MSHNHEKEHKRIVASLAEQFKDILEYSEQAVYIYLDDVNKVCNRNFSSLLGYKSPKEWAGVSDNFPTTFVAKKSQRVLIKAYQSAMTSLVGSTIDVTWKTKDGHEVETTTILVPIAHHGHTITLHFIEAKQQAWKKIPGRGTVRSSGRRRLELS